MKVITLSLSLLLCIGSTEAQKKLADDTHSGRIEKVINSQWTFNYFPSETAGKGYESPGFNDSRWPAISLPHTWNSYETTGELHPFTRSPGETGEPLWWSGWGWYRKHLTIDSDLSGHKVFLEFEGVQKYCKVWVNGKYAGDHKGGYGRFDFDITSYINPGGDNLIAVAVSYLQKDEFIIHPLSEGSFNVSCGIYRDVRIVLKNGLFIPMQGAAGHEGGTYITTPKVSETEGVVNIKTWVKNDYPQTRTCLLQTSITDRNNQVIQIIKSEAEINPGQLFMFSQTSKAIMNPSLWTVDDPYLYTVTSDLFDKKEIADSYTSSFGFRWFHVDKKDNIATLNGKKTELRGFQRHPEFPWLGDALPEWITEMEFSGKSAKGGINFIRTINYPADAVLYDQADKHGVMIEEDFSAVVVHGFSQEEQTQQIREMIRRDRNHPAIISWNPGDESGKRGNMIFASIEDSSRMIGPVPATIDTACSYYMYDNKKIAKDPNRPERGDPATIILSSSHNALAADRGSMAIITAAIGDSKGNQLTGLKNSIRWKVSGPAKLVGPAYYVSYSDSGRNSCEGWYMETPATNVIRSNGRPGKIKVTAYSSGLASGAIEIEAGALNPDNSLIHEPILADEGRRGVISNPLITRRLDEIPREISPATSDFRLTITDKAGYGRLMREYIKKSNPSIDTSLFELKSLVDLLANQLFNNEGNLSAEDFDFNVDHYNSCRLISSYIDKTKLPSLFKESLKQYYAKTIIGRGSELNPGDEMNWLNWIPSGGVVVIVKDETVSNGQKGGIIFTKKTDLTDIIKVVYPQFAKFSDEARERALIFISRMNPSVHAFALNDGSLSTDPDGNKAITYSAEKGKPILIPEYKFISE